MFSLNLRGRMFMSDRPLVMGIINATPDSFHADSRIPDIGLAMKRVDEMMEEGVDLIDIGGQSTRPGSVRIGSALETQRVLPVIKEIRYRYPELPISIDTYHADVALAAIDEGANIVNDISGGEMDPSILKVAANAGTPYICTHMQGTPETMQQKPEYEDVLAEIMGFFRRKSVECKDAGIQDLIIDPGFGFGKSLQHNYRLLSGIDILKSLGYPLLVGLSRKSMIREVLGVTTEEALNGTSILHTIALMKGADILRVHDVMEARQAVMLVEASNVNG
jgi:dihydropteroate synthase